MSALWTDLVDWRFVFFETIPLCTLAALLVWYGMPQDPPNYARLKQYDWRGTVLVVIGLGSLTTMLAHGSRLNWFQSPLICILALASLVAVPLLFVNEWLHPLPLFRPQFLNQLFPMPVGPTMAKFSCLDIHSPASNVSKSRRSRLRRVR